MGDCFFALEIFFKFTCCCSRTGRICTVGHKFQLDCVTDGKVKIGTTSKQKVGMVNITRAERLLFCYKNLCSSKVLCHLSTAHYRWCRSKHRDVLISMSSHDSREDDHQTCQSIDHMGSVHRLDETKKEEYPAEVVEQQ